MKQLLTIFAVSAFMLMSCNQEESKTPPNIVIIFLDDSGWSDFEPFGNKLATPNVTMLANEGCSFRNFYVPQAVCSASRAALLTGSYPGRTKIFGWLAPRDRGLEPEFPTMGEIFKSSGYTTALFGKWHCGDNPDTRPHSRGFDETCGLLYSNDMWKHHPEDYELWKDIPLQFWENGQVTIEEVTPEDQKHLTRWYTEHAVDFINRNSDQPFLLYVPHSMVHVPLYCEDEFEGKSGQGLFGDVILELDWSVGEINKAIKENGLEDNTIIIFTSDNGPWISYGNHAGNTPYREAKITSFDGGIRSACIIKYPPEIPANTQSSNTFCSIDLLPTLCNISGVQIPENQIDGMNVWDLISGIPDAENPHDYYAISTGSDLEAIISGDGNWKLHLPHSYQTLDIAGNDGLPGKYAQDSIGFSLFDMVNDPYETTNLADDHPELVQKLHGFAKQHEMMFYVDD
jgi:arylsulfatase A